VPAAAVVTAVEVKNGASLTAEMVTFTVMVSLPVESLTFKI